MVLLSIIVHDMGAYYNPVLHDTLVDVMLQQNQKY